MRSGAPSPLSRCGPRSTSEQPSGRCPRDELAVTEERKISPPSACARSARGEVHARAEVVARRAARPRRCGCPSARRCGSRAATPRRPAPGWRRARRRPRRGAESKTETVESPSPIDLIRLPPRASTASAISSSWRTSASAIASGWASHSAVEPSMSEQQNVTHAGRQRGRPAGAQALDQLARGLRPARRIGRHAEPDRGLELLRLRRVDALPVGQHAGRRGAGQQRERGRRERVDVARARRDRPGGELGGAVARGAGAHARHVGRGREAEVDELDPAALGQDQVAGLDVAVDHRRGLRVQVRERLGRLGEIGQHARRRQPRAPALGRAASPGRCRRPSPSRRRSRRGRRSPRARAAAPDAAAAPAARAPRRAGPRARPSSRTGRIFSATKRPCWRSSALTTCASPPAPSAASTS